MLILMASCHQCHWSWSWTSQPYYLEMSAGNVMLSACILIAGGTAIKFLGVLEHLGVMAISIRTYLMHQKEFLVPSILRTWQWHQMADVAAIRQGGDPIILGGDKRSDSPGHSAKFGMYTLTNLSSGKVLDIRTLQVNLNPFQKVMVLFRNMWACTSIEPCHARNC